VFDIPSLFGTFGTSLFSNVMFCEANKAGRLALSKAMATSLTAFARRADPNAPRALGVTWDPYPGKLIFDATKTGKAITTVPSGRAVFGRASVDSAPHRETRHRQPGVRARAETAGGVDVEASLSVKMAGGCTKRRGAASKRKLPAVFLVHRSADVARTSRACGGRGVEFVHGGEQAA